MNIKLWYSQCSCTKPMPSKQDTCARRSAGTQWYARERAETQHCACVRAGDDLRVVWRRCWRRACYSSYFCWLYCCPASSAIPVYAFFSISYLFYYFIFSLPFLVVSQSSSVNLQLLIYSIHEYEIRFLSFSKENEKAPSDATWAEPVFDIYSNYDTFLLAVLSFFWLFDYYFFSLILYCSHHHTKKIK